ncbi:CCA tRNA nucleotidyltransferase [Clostridium saccharobutylicum]|uniref:CCA-adding enzyme n=1 Tax=Clostridium saccharobutylicum DSM 13864 TaxID=1345695 RepID=U5MSK4_CLOSA|nr:CCA tRNA nucleotidyltransferase [Clostridium saccharobutylicum]AGX43590.1 CCA-adding enzyme [Clostridium saccharobutylicum DSM 13864]AQR90888.1 CCA-adding enzyme [Clostridium saccharobutylicum]AQS00792.1 CCA-adding enzyme [Clostridium saccharobutylicum]AQS14775.1 CCA-adding enzyme [Clostridium saccharobutylicum]MBA2905960.1 tRNA nucleotidyltransferase (CCA-adding enzyme) [Clostridium saccharobutylicum]
MNVKLNMPEDVKYILNKLNSSGYEAYIVGGCVRDSLLKKNPKDWDITTKARPEQVIGLFEKVILTGIKHGTVTVVINKEGYEVTTYRTDGQYEDNRHPKEVKFVTSLKEDLSRRDFTINAMAYNEENGLIDYFEGIEDLSKKIIKTVGNPNKRFNEDALRMLRAIRFSAQLDFEIEESTIDAIKHLRNNIENISKERIREEFNKILIYKPNNINLLKECGLLEYIIPEMIKTYNFNQNNTCHIYNLYEHSIAATEMIEPILHLRLTMLLHDLGKIETKTTDGNGVSHYYCHSKVSKKISEKILKNLKYDNDTINKVKSLIEYHDDTLKTNVSIKWMLNKIGESLFLDLIKVQRADIKAENETYAKDKLMELDLIENKLNHILEKDECFNLKKLKINGQNLMDIGFSKGKEIGDTLNYLLKLVIENPELNRKETLLEIVKVRNKNN